MLCFDFYSSGQAEGRCSSSWPSNEPFQGHVRLSGNLRDCRPQAPAATCLFLPQPGALLLTPQRLGTVPTVTLSACPAHLETAEASYLSKDSYPFSNQPAPLACPDLEGEDSGDSLRGKLSPRCLGSMFTNSTGYELGAEAQLLPWRLKSSTL